MRTSSGLSHELIRSIRASRAFTERERDAIETRNNEIFLSREKTWEIYAGTGQFLTDDNDDIMNQSTVEAQKTETPDLRALFSFSRSLPEAGSSTETGEERIRNAAAYRGISVSTCICADCTSRWLIA